MPRFLGAVPAVGVKAVVTFAAWSGPGLQVIVGLRQWAVDQFNVKAKILRILIS
jgi:hypothetical protein